MGLPTPNTTRLPNPRRSTQVWTLLPSPMQNRRRIRGAKVTRITAFGRDFFFPSLIVVLIFCLWVIFFVQSPATGSKWSGVWGTSMTQDGVSTIHEDVVDFNASPNVSFQVVDDQTSLTDTEPSTTNDAASDRTDSNPTMTKNKENKKDTNHSENPKEPIQETPVVWEIDESEDLPDPRRSASLNMVRCCAEARPRRRASMRAMPDKAPRPRSSRLRVRMRCQE